jgi:hypothetical protein
MILTKAILQTDLQGARAQREQLQANLNVAIGIQAALEQMLAKLDQPEPEAAPAPAPAPAAPADATPPAEPAP